MIGFATTLHYLILAGVIILLRHDIKSMALSLRNGFVVIFKNGKEPTE